MIKKIAAIVLILLLLSCVRESIVYYVNEDYVGPCIVFIKEENTDSDSIKVVNGLGVIGRTNVRTKFVFKGLKSGNELEIVPIGQESMSKNGEKKVYQLVKGKAQTDCTKRMVENIFFFIGSQKDFEQWNFKYINPFEYLDSNGIDWCNYYKENVVEN
jgi:hypothetical protein